jgi:hypothetical protein
MKDVNVFDFLERRRDIHSNCIVVPRNELEDGFPYLAEPHDNNLSSSFHDV